MIVSKILAMSVSAPTSEHCVAIHKKVVDTDTDFHCAFRRLNERHEGLIVFCHRG